MAVIRLTRPCNTKFLLCVFANKRKAMLIPSPSSICFEKNTNIYCRCHLVDDLDLDRLSQSLTPRKRLVAQLEFPVLSDSVVRMHVCTVYILVHLHVTKR